MPESPEEAERRDLMAYEARVYAELTELGEEKIREMLRTNQFTIGVDPVARRWLSDREREFIENAKEEEERSQARHAETARSAQEAAWAEASAAREAAAEAKRANEIQRKMLIAAVISAIVAIIGLVLVLLRK